MTGIQASFNEIEIRINREHNEIRRFSTGSLVDNITGSNWALVWDIDFVSECSSIHFNVQPKASPSYMSPEEVKSREFKEALGNHQELNFED